MGVESLGDAELVGLGRGGGEGQRDLAQAQFEQAVAAPRLAIIIALGDCPREDLDLAVIQAEPPVDRGDLGFDRTIVGQEDAGRAAFDDRGRDAAGLDVGEALGREHHAGVFLAQRLQPFAELGGEGGAVEHQPAFVDDDQRGCAVEPALDAVEQVRQHGGRGGAAGQALSLERLEIGVPKPLGFGVEQLAVWPADAIGAECLLQVLRLKQDRQARQRPFRYRCAGERSER